MDSRRLKIRTIGMVIRASGLLPGTIAFAVLFLLASLIVGICDPSVGGFPNAVWLMFQVVTTIGLGDFTCTTFVSRAAAIVLSLYSVFFVALITSVVVSYCSELIKLRRDESIARFIDELERLPELSHEELVELSEKVKNFERRI